MNLEQLLQAGVHCADLQVVDSHFTATGITDLAGVLHLKSVLITLANLCDFEVTVRPTYKDYAEPSGIIKPLRNNLDFSKYLRNKFVGHIHPALLAKAIEWQPMLRHATARLHDPKAMFLVNLWLLETAINTYVEADGTHKIFSSETDLMYPPDWTRFLDFLQTTVRGGIEYLKLLQAVWSPEILPDLQKPFDIELALKAGKTQFKFLAG